MSLAQTVCTVHPGRPAAARCPGCRQFFCAGCVTEHEGRLTCAACITRGAQAAEPERPVATTAAARGTARLERWTWLGPVAQILAGLAVAWTLCWFLGKAIASIPSDFHDGTRWETRTQR